VTQEIVSWAHTWLFEWPGVFEQSRQRGRGRVRASAVRGPARAGLSLVLFMFYSFLFADSLQNPIQMVEKW
jgi:hypothetical protein